jgi:hypothetical protein
MKRKLQIFVSSTYHDLLEERQAAVAAILKAGHIPAGMELFTAGDQSQMKTIERWIDESDVYMLILGGRYGSIETESGLSYTEREYDYAVSKGKPTFAVVIDDRELKARLGLDSEKYGESKNTESLKKFREKVLKNISSFFADAKDVRLCVYESLSDYAANASLKGWIAAEEVEEPKALVEEIKKLREDNSALSEQIKKLKASTRSLEKDQEVVEVLKAIKINIPASVDGKGSEDNLFNLASANRDALIYGVTNGGNSTEAERFLFYKIITKLQAHGLADSEKVPGVRYRRGFLNREGERLFAEIEKRSLLAAKQKSSEARA